jgi:flagellar hook protein FlgE
MLFTTRGSTDLPIRGVAFATEGVEDFLEGAMKTDTQDFITKMEGFAVQGVKGAAKNHQQHAAALRADIRSKIQQGLRMSSY